MRIAVTILVAVALGVAWALITTRTGFGSKIGKGQPTGRRSRRHDGNSGDPATVESVLHAYKARRYEEVIRDAPLVLGGPGDGAWRARLELVLGHSHFEMGNHPEAIEHLSAGLDTEGDTALTGRARFEHCLGFAWQKVGDYERASTVYDRLLADEDLDPVIRDGVIKNLSQIRDES